MQALLSDKMLNNTLKTHGLDVENILDKYSGYAKCEHQSSKVEGVTSNRGHLDNLNICDRCDGTGYMKEPYNHQIKEVNCVQCDGEGLLRKSI
jgi:DnaJ-class molecular chaperone